MKKRILNKIKNDEIRMKPKWWWTTREGGKRVLLALSISSASLLIGGFSYWWSIKNPAEILEFGDVGWEIFLEGFPYQVIGGMMTFIVCGLVLMSKVGENYKKSWGKIGLMTTGVLIAGSILFWAMIKAQELEVLLHFD